MKTSTKNQVLEAFNETPYKKEREKETITIWFHEGNGWNFRVIYNFEARKTKIIRYHTNGHMNTDDSKRELNGLHLVTNNFEAEGLFSNH